MKPHLTKILGSLLVLLTTAHAEISPTDPISERIISLCAAVDLKADDVSFLKQATAFGGSSECLSRAILFRHSQDTFGEEFRKYFALDPSTSVSVLSTDDINSRVNGVMKDFKGRHPAEVMARVYLTMRRAGFVAKRPDGSNLSLEVMFRGSVFTAVSGGSREEALRLAAEADKE